MAAGAIVVLVMFIMEVGNRTVRPQLFSYLFFLLTLVVIHAADSGRTRALWLMTPIVALWANFHGAFLAGLGLLAVWSGVRVATMVAGQVSAKKLFPNSPLPLGEGTAIGLQKAKVSFSSNENLGGPLQLWLAIARIA